MFIHHCFRIKGCYEGYDINFFPFSEQFFVSVAQLGKISVAIFIFLSAYGMTLSYKNKRTQNFIDKKEKILSITILRYISLMSGFVFVFFLSQFLGFFGRNQIDVYGKGVKAVIYFGLDALGLAELYKTPSFNDTWWYMSFAIVLIFIMPVLLEIYKKIGFILIPLAILLPRCLRINDFTLNFDLARWLFLITLGIWFADKDILVKIKCLAMKKSRVIKFIIATFILVLLSYIRTKIVFVRDFYDIFDGIVPVYYIIYCYNYIFDIDWINSLLKLLGKYSMNMFLIHTFIRQYYFSDLLYALKYSWLIVIVLLIVSLVISILIERMKKILKYEILITKIKNKLNGYFLKKSTIF